MFVPRRVTSFPQASRIRESSDRGGKEVNSISSQSQITVKPAQGAYPNRIAVFRKLVRPIGMTQRHLASETGVSVRELRRIEKGQVMPRASVLLRLAQSLRVPSSQLMDPDAVSQQNRRSAKRVLAVGVTSRRAALVCIDENFVIVEAEPLFLRKLSSVPTKVACVVGRVLQSWKRHHPARVVIENGTVSGDRDQSGEIITDVVARLGGVGLSPTRMSYREACTKIAGQPSPRKCAAVLAGQYDLLAQRLEPSQRLKICADDRLRDQRPLLAALSLAHATVLEEFLRLG